MWSVSTNQRPVLSRFPPGLRWWGESVKSSLLCCCWIRSQKSVTNRHGQSNRTNNVASKDILCISLQEFSSLVVTLIVTRLSCMCHQQVHHAPCPHYLAKEDITLLPRAASSVAEGAEAVVTASSGHQTRAPGRLPSAWMLGDMNMSPGLQAAATLAHTSWEVISVRRHLHW